MPFCGISKSCRTLGGGRRQAETVTYSVDMGDIRAVANSDGKLVDLVLHPSATTDYSHGELAERLNTAFAALRAGVEEDYRNRYGGELR